MNNHIGGSLNLISRKTTLGNFTWGEIEPKIGKLVKFQNPVFCIFQVFWWSVQSHPTCQISLCVKLSFAYCVIKNYQNNCHQTGFNPYLVWGGGVNPVSGIWGWDEGGGEWGRSQCIMGNGHMGTPPREQNDRQTPVKTLPSNNFVCRR